MRDHSFVANDGRCVYLRFGRRRRPAVIDGIGIRPTRPALDAARR